MKLKKLFPIIMLSLVLTTTACSGAEKNSGQQTETTTDSADTEEVRCFVTEVSDQTIKVMVMKDGDKGERPDGTRPPEGEKPEGTMSPEGEKPDGTMPPKGEKPEGTMSPNGEGKQHMKGEEKTIYLTDTTTIKKENEDGTQEEVTVSDITNGNMLTVTGVAKDDGYEATAIVVSNRQGGMGRDRQEQNSSTQTNGES